MCKMHGENSLKLTSAGDTSSGSFDLRLSRFPPQLAQKRRDPGAPFAGLARRSGGQVRNDFE